MPLDFERQSVADLEFCLYSRPLHPELFQILARRSLSVDGLEAQLWLVGGGHVVELRHPRGCLSEAAARSELLPKAGRLHVIPFRGERSQQFDRRNGVKYSMASQVEQLSPPHYQKVHEELRNCGPNALFFAGGEFTPGRPAPFSCLDAELHLGELRIQAYHAFPDELTIVKTQSLFEIGR